MKNLILSLNSSNILLPSSEDFKSITFIALSKNLCYITYNISAWNKKTPNISYENIIYFLNGFRKLSKGDDNPRLISPGVKNW